MLLAIFGYWSAGFAGGRAFPLGYGTISLWWGFAVVAVHAAD
jgi:hypothetical protein